MGERADGLRGVSRQNASGLLMTLGTDPAASACRVRHTSRRASLFSRNGDVFACLVNITPPLRSSKLTAHRKRRRRSSGPVPNGSGSVPIGSGSVPGGGRGLSPSVRGLSPSVRGLSPWGERTAYAVRTGQSIVRLHRLASAGSVPILAGSVPIDFLGACPHEGLVGSAFHRRPKIRFITDMKEKFYAAR